MAADRDTYTHNLLKVNPIKSWVCCTHPTCHVSLQSPSMTIILDLLCCVHTTWHKLIGDRTELRIQRDFPLNETCFQLQETKIRSSYLSQQCMLGYLQKLGQNEASSSQAPFIKYKLFISQGPQLGSHLGTGTAICIG